MDEPFDQDWGCLFVAPMGTTPPDMSSLDSRFLEPWLPLWRPVGVTDPEKCRVSYSGSEPPEQVTWSFGEVLTNRIKALTAVAPLSGVRFMTGWESADRKTRLVAGRCAVAEYGDGATAIRLELERKLEEEVAFTVYTAWPGNWSTLGATRE